MSGALKGYRFLTGLQGVVTSRHHVIEAARTFQASNRHQPIQIYKLPRSMPVSEGETIPESAVEVVEGSKRAPSPSTYRR